MLTIDIAISSPYTTQIFRSGSDQVTDKIIVYHRSQVPGMIESLYVVGLYQK
jgi:hypothetical protein